MTTTAAVPYQADTRTLGRAAIAAGLGAGVVLALFVLPAEYGIDPTGIGGALGLTAMREGGDDETPAPTPSTAAQPAAIGRPTQAGIAKTTAWRTDRRTLTLAPHEGIELKAEMAQGDSLVFRWTATGPVKMDMHGERSLDAPDFSTYWKQKGLERAQGSFTAPFAGLHGWYWRNQGETPVTLTLETTGFYNRLFAPKP